MHIHAYCVAYIRVVNSSSKLFFLSPNPKELFVQIDTSIHLSNSYVQLRVYDSDQERLKKVNYSLRVYIHSHATYMYHWIHDSHETYHWIQLSSWKLNKWLLRNRTSRKCFCIYELGWSCLHCPILHPSRWGNRRQCHVLCCHNFLLGSLSTLLRTSDRFSCTNILLYSSTGSFASASYDFKDVWWSRFSVCHYRQQVGFFFLPPPINGLVISSVIDTFPFQNLQMDP